MGQTQPLRVRLGAFELDLRSGELRANDQTIVLQEQPLQILRMLVEREGDLVSREEIRKRLWPNDTIVEFDHSINAAIKNLRRALGDSADEPNYIETLARRGYRLMVPVERVRTDDSSGAVAVADGAAVRLQPEPSLIGKKVSHYRVLEVIGAGGMGLVYKAEDLRLGRQVALKFLPEELLTDPAALQRFEREARTASSLNHPNICTIHDIEEHEAKPFIVMELLEGETLRDRLAHAGSDPVPLDELLDIGEQICTGLEAAHGKGIIHRDVKPANIFLTTSGQAKILDFGVAKLVEVPDSSSPNAKPDGCGPQVEAPDFSPANAEENGRRLQPRLRLRPGSNDDPQRPSATLLEGTLTRTGAGLGTAGYMSPEQIRGENLDARTDLFSFGLVLYEMATGSRAFGGETQAVLHDAILTANPVPAHDLNATLPPKLCAIIGKALEKDRERRYQSAAELRAELEKVQEGSESEAPKHLAKAGIAVAAAVLLIAVLAGGFYWRYSRAHASQAPSKLTSKDPIVLADFANSTGDPIFDGTLRQALAIQLEQSPFLKVLSDSRVTDTLKLMNRRPDEKLTSDVAREVCVRSNSKAFLKGSIARIGEQFLITEEAVNCQTGETVASAEAQAQNRNGVLQALQDVGNQLRQKLGESLGSIATLNQPLEKVTTSSLEALQEYATGSRVETGNSEYESIPYYQQAIALDPNFARAYLELGLVYSDRRDTALENLNLTKAYELRDRVSQRERLVIEGYYYVLVLGDRQKGNVAYRQLVQMYPDDSLAQHALGWSYLQLGDYESALAALQQASRLNPSNPYTLHEIGVAYFALDRYQEAKTAFEQEEALAPDNDRTRLNLWVLAFVQGDQAAMQEQAARAVGKPDEAQLLRWHSYGEAYHGRLEKSRELLERATELAQRAKQFDSAAGWQAYMAAVDAELGKTTEAVRGATDALQLSSSKDVRTAVAQIFTHVGNPAKGHALAEALNREFPADTLIQHYYLPLISAAAEMRQGNPQKAVELLDPARTYEKCQDAWVPNYYAAYLRGLAYLELGQGQNAALQFQTILDHPGIVGPDVTGALARLQLGRAYVMTGDRAKAKAAYQDFLTLWKDADPDIPIYQQAKAEYAKLE
jgi:serine/threonine protein kinase/tetratricopeptide (TPR) repeat protein